MRIGSAALAALVLAATPAAVIAAPAASSTAATAQAATPTKPPKTDTDPVGVNLARMTLGYTYFNRPGADIKAHDDDLSACVEEAAKTRDVDEIIHNGDDMGLAGLLIGGILKNAYHHGVVGAAIENCMVVKAWRVVHLPDAEGAALAALSQNELVERLTPWIGAEAPHGDIVRVWNNEATHGSINRFAIRPGHTNDGQLSLKAATGQTLKDFHDLGIEPPEGAKLDKKWPRRSVAPAKLASALPEAGILVSRLKGGGIHGMLVLQRVGEDHTVSPSTVDHAPNSLTLMSRFGGTTWSSIPIPPGRWRIAAMGGLPTLDFCLGAPSFEVKAGQVVYLGAFDFSAEDLGPDLNLAPAKAYLANTPTADKVEAAAYTNGSTGDCGGGGIFALEVKGAPFEPGYHWGGARTAAAAAPAAAPATGGQP